MTVETAPRPAVAEPTTPIRPSEALRLGRLLRPERMTGGLFSGETGACALGAIAAGAGIEPATFFDGVDELPDDGPVYNAIKARFPELDAGATCPTGCEWPVGRVEATIWHLNDSGHRWSDDQIVAWLESLGL